MTLASELSDLFHRFNYQWKLKDGSHVIPTVEQIQETLDKIAERVENDGEGTVLSVGRLLANKQPEGLEIYLYIGDYDGSVRQQV